MSIYKTNLASDSLFCVTIEARLLNYLVFRESREQWYVEGFDSIFYYEVGRHKLYMLPIPNILTKKMLIEKISRKLARAVPLKSLKMSNDQPLVSFTFDDFPKTARTNGSAILQDQGYVGTFYGCAGLLGKIHDGTRIAETKDIKILSENGHEIGCHSYAHLNCQKASKEHLQQDLSRNASTLSNIAEQSITSFAYPFGKMSIRTRRIVAGHYTSARTTVPGINHDRVCLHSLKSHQVYGSMFNSVFFEKVIAQAISTNGWLIFHTHDVSTSPSAFGCTIDQFTQLVQLVRNAGINEVHTMKSAVEFIT